MEEITGYVESIRYRNEDNGYTVLDFVVSQDIITCVGNFIAINEGENLCLKGEYVEHQLYGTQLKVSTYEMVNLIIAQRAYELNSKAIQTADSMLDTANQLKR